MSSINLSNTQLKEEIKKLWSENGDNIFSPLRYQQREAVDAGNKMEAYSRLIRRRCIRSGEWQSVNLPKETIKELAKIRPLSGYFLYGIERHGGLTHEEIDEMQSIIPIVDYDHPFLKEVMQWKH